MKHFVIGPVRLVTLDGIRENAEVEVKDGKILAVRDYQKETALPRVDGEGYYLAPGFVDLHVHGGGGSDFMDGTPEAFKAAAKSHMQHGTTAMAPTTLTASLDELCSVFDVLREVKASPEAAAMPELLGIHMEGPYVAPSQAGAQDPKYIRCPEDGSYKVLAEAAQGAILIWTVAPELPGAAKICEDLRKTGIRFSLGHTEAQYKHVKEAVDSGYTMATHLFSSMSTITRENGFRRLGAIESSLLLDEIDVEVIADGMHLPPELLQLIYKIKGKNKMILVTDAMRGAGMPDGIYKLGSLKQGQDVLVGGGIARMPDGISFAGSIATTDRLVRVMTKQVGLPLHEAVAMMTYNPAKAVGLEDRIGQIQPGLDADIVLFNENIDIQKVFIKGEQTV